MWTDALISHDWMCDNGIKMVDRHLFPGQKLTEIKIYPNNVPLNKGTFHSESHFHSESEEGDIKHHKADRLFLHCCLTS